MADPLVYSAALMMGLFSAPHCLVMCGGLISAFSMGAGKQNLSQKAALVFKLNSGRLFTYTLLGLIGGLFGAFAAEYVPGAQLVLRSIAGILLIFCGLYIAGIWFGLKHFETLVQKLWQKIGLVIKPNGNKGFLTGVSWGCLPCGLVYSALTIALTQGNVLSSGLFMLFFGLGTLPVLFSAGLASSAIAGWLKNDWVKRGSGLLLVCYGFLTIISPFYFTH